MKWQLMSSDTSDSTDTPQLSDDDSETESKSEDDDEEVLPPLIGEKWSSQPLAERPACPSAKYQHTPTLLPPLILPASQPPPQLPRLATPVDDKMPPSPTPRAPSPTLNPNRYAYPPFPPPESPTNNRNDKPRTFHPFQTSDHPASNPRTTLRYAIFSPSRSPRYIWTAFRIVAPHSVRKWMLRLSAWFIVLFRLATAVLNVLGFAFSQGDIALAVTFGIIFGVVALWFVMGCLAIVMNEGVEGGYGGGRYHLDYAMGGLVLAHVGWLFWMFGYHLEPFAPSEYSWHYSWPATVMWWVLGVMVFGLAWVVLRGKRGNYREGGQV
ncbi:hypothetical protein QBC34DRAFT_463633 [Podospora aff. communis PSN243]|uniref:MARVEL domain-containing protein n=1 Tax=Podospora aff. communis PSN243 TaxID=3040156 RepID=A0AAV9GKJ2_9PEZI|nr:hypothetical protein QBC34DRAFT_463633 [Podospora aff. communis PSN243]